MFLVRYFKIRVIRLFLIKIRTYILYVQYVYDKKKEIIIRCGKVR